jgi:hypothetical protein
MYVTKWVLKSHPTRSRLNGRNLEWTGRWPCTDHVTASSLYLPLSQKSALHGTHGRLQTDSGLLTSS